MKTQRILMLCGLIVLAATGAGIGLAQAVLANTAEKPHAVTRARTAGDAIAGLPARLKTAASHVGLELGTTRQVAPDVFLANKNDGELCMIGTAHGMTMGCGSSSDFFGGNSVQYGISEDGAPSAPTALTIFGVVRPDVRSVRVVFPSGPVDEEVTVDGGFSVTATAAQLASGRPTQLIAYGQASRIIQTFALPQS